MSGKGLYPAWKPVLETIFPTRIHMGKNIVSLACAVGCGKSTISTIMTSFTEARIDHLDNQKFIRGMDGKNLGFGLAHTTTSKAMSDFAEPLANIKNDSPYWSSNRVSHNVVDYKLGGERSIKSLLGGDLIMSVLSEVNFWNYHSAKYAIQSMIGRINSRFIHAKSFFGLLVLDSSPSDKAASVVNDFLDENPDIYNVEMSIWKAKAHQNYFFTLGHFYVFIGDQTSDPFILKDGMEPEDLPSEFDKDMVIKVPEELRMEFQMNTPRALKDQAGIISGGHGGLFIKDKVALNAAFTEFHNNNKDVIEVDFYDIKDTLYDHLEASISKMPKQKIIFIGIDIGVTNDLTGIAIGYFDDFIYPYGEGKGSLKEPTFIINTVVGVSRKTGQETSISKIKELIVKIADEYEIGGVSCDQFQSRQLLQDLQQLNIPTKNISVDRTNLAYNYFKNTIYTKRVKLPSCPWLRTELTNLQMNDGKVDHLQSNQSTVSGGGKYSKDLADAVCCCLYHMNLELKLATELSTKYSNERARNLINAVSNSHTSTRDIRKNAQLDILKNIF